MCVRRQVREEVAGAEAWLYDLLAKQGELPAHADPVLTVGAMKERQNALAHVSIFMLSRLAFVAAGRDMNVRACEIELWNAIDAHPSIYIFPDRPCSP